MTPAVPSQLPSLRSRYAPAFAIAVLILGGVGTFALLGNGAAASVKAGSARPDQGLPVLSNVHKPSPLVPRDPGHAHAASRQVRHSAAPSESLKPASNEAVATIH